MVEGNELVYKLDEMVFGDIGVKINRLLTHLQVRIPTNTIVVKMMNRLLNMAMRSCMLYILLSPG